MNSLSVWASTKLALTSEGGRDGHGHAEAEVGHGVSDGDVLQSEVITEPHELGLLAQEGGLHHQEHAHHHQHAERNLHSGTQTSVVQWDKYGKKRLHWWIKVSQATVT